MRSHYATHEPVCVVRLKQHALAAVVPDGAGRSGSSEAQWGKSVVVSVCKKDGKQEEAS